MRNSLVAVAILLLSGCIGSAQEKSAVHVLIQATPEQIKKAALAIFARNGYSLDSDNTTQLKISKPFSEEEIAAYNTAHWTNQLLANCRHVQKFLLSRADQGTDVAMATEMVCYNGRWWFFGHEKETQGVQNILADLKVKTEETNKRR